MSVLYDVRLVIKYDYDSPAGSHRAHLRMQPLTSSGQRLLSGYVSTTPVPDYRQDDTDFFGNAQTEIGHDRPLDRVTFRFGGRVERMDPPGGLDLSCPLPDLARDIAATMSMAPEAPHHFIGYSDRILPSADISSFARDVSDRSGSTLAVVEQISTALNAEMVFDPTATDVMTVARDAFHNRRGVCQDMSHILITALRSLGIPAGYVSGFLRTEPPEGQPRLEGVDAMHAWVRAWCGHEMGWVEIDPTNAMQAGTDHIAVAIGRDYADVAPVKGAHRASGTHETTHSVDVVAV